MKIVELFTCRQCAYQTQKWVGKCPSCDAWNSFEKEEVVNKKNSRGGIRQHAREPLQYSALMDRSTQEMRIPIGIDEIDRVLGGGIVPGSLLLLTGEPGIGKSTLTLQIAEQISRLGKKVLYISGEESESQIALRGRRLGLTLKNLLLLSETNIETILATAEKEKCDFLIVDSIQVVSTGSIPGSPGSVSQVRLSTEALLDFAKPRNMPVLIIGHVTKDGTLAGPRVLEHLVDTVLYLEGSRTHDHRILRGVKNRFGSVNEVGIFEMAAEGLRAVSDAASFFIRGRSENAIGSVLTLTTEGGRPLLLEVQALTSPTVFGYPRRTANGFDTNRLNMLIAVLQKYLDVNLTNQDVYVNVVSGYRLQDPLADLAICLAVLSSFRKKPFPHDLVAVGEVGLAGEIRADAGKMAKIKEAVGRLGLRTIINNDLRTIAWDKLVVQPPMQQKKANLLL